MLEHTPSPAKFVHYSNKATGSRMTFMSSVVHNIRVRKTDNEIRNYAYTLSEGLKSELRSYKYFGTIKREIPSIIKDIEEFLK